MLCGENMVRKTIDDIDIQLKNLEKEIRSNGHDNGKMLELRVQSIEKRLDKLECKLDLFQENFTSKLLYAVLILSGVIAGTKLLIP